MGLNNAAVNAGTTLSFAGGTAKALTPDGQTVQNGLHLIDASVADFRTRPSATVKFKAPSLDSLGIYGKDKKSIVYVEPMLLASGKTVFNLVRIEREIHPETSAAAALDLLTKGAQMCFRTDFTQFWATGSLA